MNKKYITDLLKIASAGLAENSQMPGLDCFRFEDDKVTAWNGALTIIGDLEEPFPVNGFIQGKPLVEVLNHLPEEIDLIAAENELKIKSGRSISHFPVMDYSITFPEPDLLPISSLPVSSLFYAAIKRCMISIPTKGKLEEAGIYLFKNGNEYHLLSTNRATYSSYKFHYESTNDDDPETLEVMLPALFCEQYTSIVENTNTSATEIMVGTGYIKTLFPTLAIYCSFYNIPISTDLRNTVDKAVSEAEFSDIPEGLDLALRRAEIIDQLATITYGGDTLEITAVGKGKQEFQESIAFTSTVKGSIQVDAKYFRKALLGAKRLGFGENYLIVSSDDYHFIMANRAASN